MQIVSRAEWDARPPKTTPYRIPIPTPELWLHHTASADGGAARVRAIQDFHMDVRGWSDIAYSFLINGAGQIFMGRGVGIAGGHTAGHNTISHAICVLGNFNDDQPTDAAVASIVELARHGYAQGWWPEGFTGGHRDASGANTSCPGDNLHELLPYINVSIKEPEMALTEGEENTAKALHAALVAAGAGTLASRTALLNKLVALAGATADHVHPEYVKGLIITRDDT
jgi:hypothetical protein